MCSMCIRFSPTCDLYSFPLRRAGSFLICRPARYKDYKDDGFRMALSCRKKTAKAMIPVLIASVTKNPLRKSVKTPYTAQLPFSSLSDSFRMLPCFGLCFAWFVGLLTDLFRLRVSSPLAISRLTANALLQPSLRAMTALPMTGFYRAQDLPCTENNTLEIQLLSEFCPAVLRFQIRK